MNKLQRIFNKERVFLPVIHACSFEQVHRQAYVAIEAGADGVLLINQGGLSAPNVVQAAAEVAFDTRAFVGVNVLGRTPLEVLGAISLRPLIRGLWTDNAEPANWSRRSQEAGFGPHETPTRLYFGGVAFKGQLGVHASRYGEVAREAAAAGVDVVTTSGAQTGTPPGVAKIRAMRGALGDHPLAIASGISAGNVGAYLPFVDAFIVASSIEMGLGVLDPGKTAELAALIHAWKPPAEPAPAP